MKVIPVPCRSDNYMYIILHEITNTTAVVDPYDPVKLEAAAKEHGVKLGDYLLLTHHHSDHSDGNAQFIQTYPNVKVYAGSDKIAGVTNLLKNGDTFKIGEIEVKALATPCHTQDHICFYTEDKKEDQRGVFTGDTLFVSGCGRFFEGTAQEMNVALNETLASLPDDTTTYVGHEYTASNVAFSKFIDPGNAAIVKLSDYCKENSVTTGKFTIGDEKGWNVFMRVTSQAVREKTGCHDPIDAMGALRDLKNNFKG